MFNGAHAFNQDISSWDVGQIENMWWMFEDARAFNQDISSWNVERVKNMDSMFTEAHAFNQNLGAWNPISLETAVSFYNANTAVSRENYDKLLNGWSAKNVKNGVTFSALTKKYCLGESGRNILGTQK